MPPDPFESYSTCAGLSRGPAPAWQSPDFGGLARSAPAGVYSGAMGFGSGGPTHLDAYRTKRAPTPAELVNAVKAVSYACIKINSVALAKVPLRLYAVRRKGQAEPIRSYRRAPDAVQRRIRFGGDGRGPEGTGLARSIDTHDEIDEILDHDLLRALERPNPYFDRPTFLMYLCASLDSLGSAFFYPSRPIGADGMADPTYSATEYWPLQSQYVYPAKGSAGELVDRWRYFGDSYAHKELVRVRWFSLRDPYLSAYAPLHACYEQTSLVDYYTASVEGVLKGGARPEVLVGPKDPAFRWGEVERDRFEQDVNNQFVGNKKKVWVADGSFDVHTLSYPLADLGGLTISKEQRLLCANCFDVPISLLQSEDSNRATAQESTHQHQYYGIAPRCSLISAAMTNQLAQPVDDRLFFYFDDPVSRDVERDAKVWAMKVEKGQATINEWRADDDGRPAVPWGDEPWMSNTLSQPSTLAKAAEGGAEGGAGGEAGAGTVAADDVQAQALNGAQISSLVEVIQNVRDGIIPPGSAAALLKAAFPLLSPEQITAIINPIEVKPPPDPPPTPPDPGTPPAADEAARSARLEERMTQALDAIARSLDEPADRGEGDGGRDDFDWPEGASPE